MVHGANSSECPACGGTQPRHIGRLWNLPFDVYHCGKCDRHYAAGAGRDAIRSLSAEERRLATLTVQGRLVKQIARELGVSIRTVAFKRADLMQKLGATNSAELIRLIVESGLLAETEESRNVDFEVTRLHNYQSRIRAPSCFETRREVMNAVAPLRVFVVDDDRDTTECMQLLLRHWGHEVHVANEARLAVEQARFVEPDLMLVDLHMPVLDGLAVARHIRDLPDLAQTTLVAVTGFADARHKEQALDAGFDEYLIKPLPAEVLKALLNRVGSRVTATRGRSRSRLSIEAAAISMIRRQKCNERWRSRLYNHHEWMTRSVLEIKSYSCAWKNLA